ncbi:MAG: saccharopine dehydrogenase NADP-binding domain-containing protein [Bacillota bacterium]|nr:saccharopine dehydrogenase NADP-binding domain-containing protein [Bacillota bacterium]
MKLMVVGCGGVGKSIIKIMKERDPEGTWLEKVIMADYDLDVAKAIEEEVKDDRFKAEKVDAMDKQSMIDLIEKYGIDFVADCALPFMMKNIFDAAFEGGASYCNMGVWSDPKPEPDCYGIGKDCFKEFMCDYNFPKHQAWEEKGLLAVMGLGIEPGTIDVFARYAADHLFDELHTIDVKDGSNMEDPTCDPDEVAFAFNVWTVMDECMNPNVTWYKDKGFVCDKPFCDEETFEFPDGIGPVKLYKIEHEEPLFMSRALADRGLQRVSYKIGLDENLVAALKSLAALGLRSTEPVEINGTMISPRDFVAKVAPQPDGIDENVFGKTCGGVLCEGIKDGMKRKIFLYQTTDQQESLDRFGTQAVVAQTGFGAAIGIELIGRGIWTGTGIQTPECFDAVPYMELMQEANFPYGMVEYDSEYKSAKGL